MAVIQETEFYSLTHDEIYKDLGVKPDKGLSQEQIGISQEKHGLNLIEKKPRSIWKVLIAPVINLLIILYLISAFAMWILGEVQRTTPTFIILGANAFIAIIQQLRAEKQLQALQKLSEATATVLRDGQETVVPADQVVVGDVVLFRQGDKIPADCRIIKTMNLSIDEASLTGESEPVKKSRDGAPIDKSCEGSSLPLQDQKNMLFLGTFVTSGSASAIVVKVGTQTEIGKISLKLEETSTGEIPLRKKMNHFAKYLGLGVLTLLTLSIIYKSILLVNLDMMTGENFRMAMVDSIDLGMKVMPINLPLLTTIVLLTGVLLLAQKGVIVRELSRTESLGRVSVVCSDKTGTLTKNEMTVHYVWTPNAEYQVTGSGYSPEGAIKELNGDEIFGHKHDLDKLIASGFLNNNAIITTKEVDAIQSTKVVKKIQYNIIGLPTEAAIKVLAEKYGSYASELSHKYKFIHEFNFDSSIKRMSKLYQSSENENELTLFSKGATEWILPLCTQYFKNELKPMTEAMKTIIMSKMQHYADQGYRILTITSREIDGKNNPFNVEDENARETLEKELTFLGLVVIMDPPRDDVFEAVKQCKSAGIKPIMITGDSISTGKAIAEQLAIYDPSSDRATEGKNIARLTEEEFFSVSVFGRVSPDHKQYIVEKYQKRGQLVAMTGDGVNDALALSMADCGLAMGITGTEVAKEAADMIITDDSFSTIITGIREGRGLYEKIRTIVYFFICVSLMEAIILFSSSLSSNPYFAMWDYWQLNLLYLTAHFFPSIGFTFGTTAKKIMDEKPKDSAEIIDAPLFKLMMFQMFLMGISIVIAYLLPYTGALPVSDFNLQFVVDDRVSNAQAKARTMAFVVLFTLEGLLMPMQIRRINNSVSESFKDINYKKEVLLYPVSILMLVGLIYSIEAQTIMDSLGLTMGFMALDFFDWLICIGLCMVGFLGFELVRWYFREKKRVVF